MTQCALNSAALRPIPVGGRAFGPAVDWHMDRLGMMNAIALRAGCLGLGILCASAGAQDGDGTARVQRDAGNPLRMILEAGKLKPRAKADETDAPSKAGAEAKPVSPKAPPPPQVGVLPGILVPDLAPLSDGIPAALETVAFVPPAPYDPDNYFGVAPPAAGGATIASRSSPAVAQPATVPAQAPRATLQLVDYVAPAIDERTRRKLKTDGEVVLAFTVNPDGSVSDLSVSSASDRALEPAALDAVSKWRYQPIASAQAHGVQLVFKRGE
jgi:TonB family protein